MGSSSRSFLVRSGEKSVVCRLDLSDSPGDLRVLSSRQETVQQLEQLRERLGDDPEAWLHPFMRGEMR
jgi:type IV secretion system protein VirB4